MDARAMYPDGFHPCKPSRSYDWKTRAKYFSRTRCPPRYYLIDYGFSEVYDAAKPRPLTYAILSGGVEPPETKEPCDPFATDVYLLGMMVRRDILDVRSIGTPLNDSNVSLSGKGWMAWPRNEGF